VSYTISTYTYAGECVEISGVTGVMQRLALAKMYLSSPLFSSESDSAVIVVCLDNLPCDLLLDNAFFETNSHLCDAINSQNDSLVNGTISHVIDLNSSQSSSSPS